MNDSNSPKPELRWHQVTMRTLLVVAVVLSFAFGWIGIRLQRARTNRERLPTLEKPVKEAVAEIEKLDGTCWDSTHYLRSQTYLEKLFKDPGGVDDPIIIRAVTAVILNGTEINDAGLKHLKRLTNLQVLHLDNTQITDAGLEHLQGLTTLTELHLDGVEVSDTGLEYLNALTNLRTLRLWGTKVTGEGVKQLEAALPQCQIHWNND